MNEQVQFAIHELRNSLFVIENTYKTGKIEDIEKRFAEIRKLLNDVYVGCLRCEKGEETCPH